MSKRVLVLAVGRLNEPFWRDACAEYVRRLSRYAAVEVTETPDKPDPLHSTAKAVARALDEEGEALLARIRPEDFVVALAVDGRAYASEELAEAMRDWMETKQRVVFVIGGSNGLSAAVLRRANERISLSAMTFPHALARVVLLEQVYRAQKIIAGEPYHK